MSALGDSLRVVLADTFALYLKTHNYHWNVEGPDFYEFHIFFDGLYNELWSAVDAIAEHIRAINEYSPGSFGRFSDLTTIKDATTIPSGVAMAKNLLDDNDRVIDSLNDAYRKAESEKEVGLSNFLQDRIDIHKKHGWMLRSTTKNR
jgi:starvation-inducible DNA-binding protein